MSLSFSLISGVEPSSATTGGFSTLFEGRYERNFFRARIVFSSYHISSGNPALLRMDFCTAKLIK